MSKKKKIIYKKSQIIKPSDVGQFFFIFNGRQAFKITVYKEMVGHRFGEYVYTRGLFSHGNSKKKK